MRAPAMQNNYKRHHCNIIQGKVGIQNVETKCSAKAHAELTGTIYREILQSFEQQMDVIFRRKQEGCTEH